MNLEELDKEIRIAMENALKAIQISQIEMNKAFRSIDEIKKKKPYLKLVK